MGDTVELEMLGQASFAARVGPEEIVSDPWVVRSAQLGGWEPFPPRGAREIEAQRARVNAATHIFLSHDHADHFDPEFLAQLAPKRLALQLPVAHDARLRHLLLGELQRPRRRIDEFALVVGPLVVL